MLFRQHATPTIEGHKSYHRPPVIHPKHERHKLIWVALLLVLAKPISINAFFFPCHGRLTTNRIVSNTNPNLLIQSHKPCNAILAPLSAPLLNNSSLKNTHTSATDIPRIQITMQETHLRQKILFFFYTTIAPSTTTNLTPKPP
jgi:hypothetical protein